jgi:hypothetical protein
LQIVVNALSERRHEELRRAVGSGSDEQRIPRRGRNIDRLRIDVLVVLDKQDREHGQRANIEIDHLVQPIHANIPRVVPVADARVVDEDADAKRSGP